MSSVAIQKANQLFFFMGGLVVARENSQEDFSIQKNTE
jgi:hypothetical protein